jgi:flagellar biogenesis protein FliO
MDLAFQTIAVLAVLGAMAAVLWALNRRRPTAQSPSDLRLEGRVPLTPNHSLHVVRFRGSQVLVATHPGGCSILALPGAASEEVSQ